MMDEQTYGLYIETNIEILCFDISKKKRKWSGKIRNVNFRLALIDGYCRWKINENEKLYVYYRH